jgi:hypothetical protein
MLGPGGTPGSGGRCGGAGSGGIVSRTGAQEESAELSATGLTSTAQTVESMVASMVFIHTSFPVRAPSHSPDREPVPPGDV